MGHSSTRQRVTAHRTPAQVRSLLLFLCYCRPLRPSQTCCPRIQVSTVKIHGKMALRRNSTPPQALSSQKRIERIPGIPTKLGCAGHERVCKRSWYDRRRRAFDTMRSNMFRGSEDDQDQRHDQGTINKVLGDTDTEQGGDAPEEDDRGTHNGYMFSSTQFKSGVIIRAAGNIGTIL